MLLNTLIHPEILSALASAGHGSKVLIADGNYPVATATHSLARRVFLNLRPGLVNVVDVLAVLCDAIPIEAAHVMVPNDGSEPPIFSEFRTLLSANIGLSPLNRNEFYATACTPDLALVIATGEQRIYANILLTIGVRNF